MSGLTGQTTNLNTNQLSENIYCNSEAYNVIYDASYILSGLLNIQPTVDALLNTHISYFSQYLDANIGVPTPGNEITVHPEMNRRNLKVFSKIYKRHPKLIVYVMAATYEFDFYDTINTYISNRTYTIHGKICRYKHSLGKGLHKFETENIDIIHFSFHGVKTLSPQDKSVGAFHLKFDYINKKVFRPFIIHPVRSGYEFYPFLSFNRYLIDYYTTNRTSPVINEFTSYLTRNSRMNNAFIVSNIVIPTYDIIITKVLNPLARLNLPSGTVIPIPEPDTNQGVTKTCIDMMANPGIRPRWFGGKKSSKRTRSRPRKQRKRTLKHIRG